MQSQQSKRLRPKKVTSKKQEVNDEPKRRRGLGYRECRARPPRNATRPGLSEIHKKGAEPLTKTGGSTTSRSLNRTTFWTRENNATLVLEYS
jgi:hypothetical protein